MAGSTGSVAARRSRWCTHSGQDHCRAGCRTATSLSVTLSVAADAVEDMERLVSLELTELTDTSGTTRQPANTLGFPVAGTFRDRHGLVASGNDGTLFVAATRTLGITATAAQARLINTVPLTGSTITSPITVYRLTDRGTTAVINSGITFTSSSPNVLATTGTGAALTSAQTVASAHVEITATTLGHSTIVPFAVRTVQGPLVVTTVDNELGPVEGLGGPKRCILHG